MSSEAPFSITGKGSLNELVTLRGDSWAELVAHATEAVGAAGEKYVQDAYAHAFRSDAFPPAVANVAAALGPVSVIGNGAVGNGPLPQPGVVPQPAPAAAPVAGPPPTAQYPGDCVHGVRPFKNSNTARGAWQRWDCASPWVKGNDAHNATRCRAINA
jgi:hypothetical protein